MPSTLLFTFLQVSLLSLSLSLVPARAYVWPDPTIDDLEAAFVQINGFDSLGFADAVQPCGVFKGAPNTGRQTAAEWLRVAYHDMATHDVATGTGGMDASIGYEASRPENIGTAITGSMQFFLPFMSRRTSMSDLLALGAVSAVRSCSPQMRVPLRAGRVDATKAGPPGVPQPQEGLDVHTKRFAAQGFNVSEMIALVACGHTIGGVHEEDFPEIVKGVVSPQNQGGMVHFDGTFDSFDNNVAVQFIQGTTQNPLVKGPNVTNSDGRIFNADGGSVMRQLSGNNAQFLATCNSLLERMLNVVPSNVRLTAPITPIPVKPVDVEIQIATNGSLQFSGNIRLADFPSASSARVFLHYQASQGSNPPSLLPLDLSANGGVIPTTTDAGRTGRGFDTNLQFFTFNQKISPAQGIKSFWVEIQNGASSRNETNGGGFFPMSDAIIVAKDRSCVSKGQKKLQVVAAVRQNAGIDSVSVAFTQPVKQPGIVLPRLSTNTFSLSKAANLGSPAQGYDFYQGTTSFTPLSLNARATFDVIGKRGGSQVASNDFVLADLLPDCPF